MLDLMDENKRGRKYFTINCFSTSIRLKWSLSSAHKSETNVRIRREQCRNAMSAVYVDEVGVYINQPRLYCVSTVWWIWSVCFFHTWVQDIWSEDTQLPWKETWKARSTEEHKESLSNCVSTIVVQWSLSCSSGMLPLFHPRENYTSV